eukprot:2427892-Prorocentrum_lima.AAC.1
MMPFLPLYHQGTMTCPSLTTDTVLFNSTKLGLHFPSTKATRMRRQGVPCEQIKRGRASCSPLTLHSALDPPHRIRATSYDSSINMRNT